MLIPLPFLITGLFGLVLVIYGVLIGKRTGKIHIYALILVGVGLMVVSTKAWSDFKHIERGSVYARP